MIIDKQSLINADTNSPSFTEDEFAIDWSMTRNERYCFIQLLQKIKPKIAIEIGTFNGGSLQVISKYAEKVYAIDTDASVKERLGSKFKNVEFLIGDSKTIAPQLIQTLQENNDPLEFVLIDGDHSTNGVYQDIKNILNYKPKTSLHIILHDSFNPTCRKGMKLYDYNKNENVHYVELDFTTGIFSPEGLKRQMWGGFAMVLMLAEKRTAPLKINESQKKLHNLIYLQSFHLVNNLFWFLKPLFNFLKK